MEKEGRYCSCWVGCVDLFSRANSCYSLPQFSDLLHMIILGSHGDTGGEGGVDKD